MCALVLGVVVESLEWLGALELELELELVESLGWLGALDLELELELVWGWEGNTACELNCACG